MFYGRFLPPCTDGSAHQFQAPTAHQLGPLHQLAAVGPIGPDHLQSVVATHQAFQYQPSTVAIPECRGTGQALNVGGMHYRRQQQPQSIHHNVTFASLYPLARVVTSRPPFFGGLHRLAVNDGSTGTGCPTLGLSQVGKEGVVGPLPGPILTPGAEVMEDNAPRWQVVGQHPPRATGAQHVANGVYDLAPRVLHRPTAGFGRRQQRFQQLPLFVVQIAGVNRSLHATTLRPTPNLPPLSSHPD